jgi:hypothetical protein
MEGQAKSLVSTLSASPGVEFVRKSIRFVRKSTIFVRLSSVLGQTL